MAHDDVYWEGLDPHEEWTEPTLHGDTQDDFGVPDDIQWDEMPREDRESVANNYLLGGPDVDTFGTLNLPVVDPEGDIDDSNDQLSKKGLQAADSYAMRVEGYTEQEKRHADRYANEMLRRFF